MPRQQSQALCDECEARITYTATPTSSPDRGKYIQIEDIVRECEPACRSTDARIMEVLEMAASEPFDEREDS